MDAIFRFPKMLVLIVLSRLLMSEGLAKQEGNLQSDKNKHDNNSKENDKVGDSSEEDETRDSLPTSNAISTTETISRSSSHTNEDYNYTKNSKIDLTLVIPLIIAALILGAAVMVIIFCINKKCKSQREHHASNLSDGMLDKNILTSSLQMSDAVYEHPDDNINPSANNELVTFGEKHRVPSPNDYEILSEHGHQRSSLEHPYGCVLAGSDVNPDTHNEHSEVINTGVEHDYFVLSLSEADEEKSTGGSEIKMVNANHDYFVLAPDECAFKTNKMEMAEKTHDYFVLERHTNDEEL